VGRFAPICARGRAGRSRATCLRTRKSARGNHDSPNASLRILDLATAMCVMNAARLAFITLVAATGVISYGGHHSGLGLPHGH
jgi:hypothetical protein